MASPLAWSFVQRHPRPVEMEILEMDVNCSTTKKWRYWKWMSTAVPRRNGDTSLMDKHYAIALEHVGTVRH